MLFTLLKLLPRGQAFSQLSPDGVLYRTLAAFGALFDQVRQRGIDLMNEADPRTATETLADWERVLSLPDARVTAIAGTSAARRIAITQKLIARGGQNSQFFFELVKACGWTLTSLTITPLLRTGFRVNARVYEANWATCLQFHISATPATGALTQQQLEAVVRHVLHAHITAQFVYA